MSAVQESPTLAAGVDPEELRPDVSASSVSHSTPALPAASLRGVKVACFYPWLAFDATRAWSRFTCLWRFLLEEGAEVTLAFLEPGGNVELKGLSVRYQGDYTAFFNRAATTRIAAMVKSMAELKQYSQVELDFLLRYEKSSYLGNAKVGPWLDEIIGHHDIVTCEYPLYAPLLSEYCKKWQKPLVVTSLDILYELHGVHPRARERLKENELRALSLADALFFCNEQERQVFAKHGLKGVTVMNTGDVLGVTPGNEEKSCEWVRTRFNIKTPRYCLFVGSAHGPNAAAAAELRRMAKAMPEISFVVVGNCAVPVVENNFFALGAVTDELLDKLYRGALAILVPLTRGTGQSVKTFQALIYGKPVVTTPVGARGYAVTDGQELLIAPTLLDFPICIRRLLADAPLRQSVARKARDFAINLDFRTHFQPYAETINRLLGRANASAAKDTRSLFLVDNNLTDRIGHHFNYALSLKEQCLAEGSSFHALVKRTAPADVLSDLSGHGAFSQGIHEDCPANPFPAEWGNLRSLYDFLLTGDNFARELETGLAGRARPDDLVFLPNATPRQILGLALFLMKHPLYRTLRFALILRYSVHVPTGPITDRKLVLDKVNAERYQLALEKLQQADSTSMVRLATDSAGLAEEFATYSKRPIEVLPIPHTLHQLPGRWPADVPVKARQKIRIVYMGDAREEKGFEFLPAVIRACAGHPVLASVEFVLQAFISSHYHQRMALVIDELERLQRPNVHLLKSPLSTDSYQALLASADIVLLPYDAATYGARTSGPFVEAICADKPVVVPRSSWMSAQLGESRAGETFVSGNAQDLGRAVLAAISNIAAHTAAARALGARFRAYHNPQSFMRQMMGPAGP